MAPKKLEAGGSSVLGEQARTYFLSFFPPHIRRRGLSAPPLKGVALRYIRYLSLPYFPWATMDWRKYPKLFPSDLLAGVTVAIMLVPQGLAYSVLATLPAIYGLYTSTIAGYIYSIFGTSGQLTIGPVALVSFFMSETFSKMGVSVAVSDKDPLKNKAAKYATHVRTQLAPVISLAVGLMLCAMAFFRIGSLMKFLSPSVLTGFVTGSGLQIFISQSKYMWGVKVPRADKNYKEWRTMFKLVAAGKGNRWDQVIGFSSFAVLFIFYFVRKGLQPKLRAMKETRPVLAYVLMLLLSGVTLAVIIVTTCFAWYEIRHRGNKVAIVGKVPAGFNKFEVPAVFNDFYGEGLAFSQVLLQSIPLTFLTYMESVSVARKYALVNRYALDMTQELWALGFGCIAASFFTSYPLGGSFSRTALKADMGVRTPFANTITSLFVTLVLVAATNLLTFVPMSVLGAVICTSIMSLLDFGEMWRALWVAPVDFIVMVFTFAYTAIVNVEWGLIWGIMASVVVLLLQISKLDIDSIGLLRLEEPGRKPHFRPKNNIYPNLLEHQRIKVLRLTANLFFGNVSVFRDEFYASLATSDSQVRAVIVDAQGVPEVDLSALAVIDEMVAEVEKQGVRLYFAGCHSRVIKGLDSFDLLEQVGGAKLVAWSVEDVFVTVAEELDLEDGIAVGIRSRSASLGKAAEAFANKQLALAGTVGTLADEEEKEHEFKDPLNRV